MKSEILSQERNVVVVKSEFDSDEVDSAIRKTVRELSNKANIKGFRRGHVPRKTLELYFGKDGIYKETLEKMAQQALESIISEYELDLITEPQAKFGEIADGRSLEMEFSFEVRPEVVLPDLSTLSGEKIMYRVDDADVDAAFAQLLESHAELVPIDEDRPVAGDDLVSVEYTSFKVADNGFATEIEKDRKTTFSLASEAMRGEIAKAIVGKSLAEAFSFEVKLEEDYPDKRMAGATIRYDMEVLQILKRVVPEPTDEKIGALSKGRYGSADELKADLRAQMERDAKEHSDSSLRESAVKALAAAAEVDVPESMVDRQYNAMRREREGRVRRDLNRSLDEYLKFNNLDVEEHDSNLRRNAEEIVRNTLVLDALAERDEINFTTEDINEEIMRLANSMRVNPQELADSIGKNREEFASIVARVRTRNTMNHLASKVQVQEVEPSQAGERAALADDVPSEGRTDEEEETV